MRTSPSIERQRAPLELKLAGIEPNGTFAGIASTFGGLDAYGDTIKPGAYRKTLADHAKRGTTPAMLWSHRHDEPIGRWLKIEENEKGLSVEGKLTLEVGRAREAYSLLRDRAVTGLSIGYTVPRGGMTRNDKGRRILTEINLWEISLVALPADQNARIAPVKSIRELEVVLRDAAGFGPKAAKKIAAGGWPALSGSETDPSEVAEVVRLIRERTSQLHQLAQGKNT